VFYDAGTNTAEPYLTPVSSKNVQMIKLLLVLTKTSLCELQKLFGITAEFNFNLQRFSRFNNYRNVFKGNIIVLPEFNSSGRKTEIDDPEEKYSVFASDGRQATPDVFRVIKIDPHLQ
jgi:hypothetical protein